MTTSLARLVVLGLFVVVALRAHSAIAIAASVGCSSGSAGFVVGGSTSGSIVTPDGRNRTFVVYVPPGYRADQPTPVVFLLHGGFGTGAQAQNAYGMDVTASQKNFVVVYPDGVQRTWNGGRCCGAAVTLDVDDVGFIGMLLDHIEAKLCIDEKAVFATGMSNGAIMSYRLACELSDRVTAIAPVAGTLMFSPCSPSRPVPVFHIHGLLDLNVPFEGGLGCGVSGADFTSIPDAINTLAGIDGCSCRWEGGPDAGGSCLTTYLTQGETVCHDFGPCSKANVALCTVPNGGHSWPGSSTTNLDIPGCNATTARDFNANEHMWEFFAASIDSGASNLHLTLIHLLESIASAFLHR